MENDHFQYNRKMPHSKQGSQPKSRYQPDSDSSEKSTSVKRRKRAAEESLEESVDVDAAPRNGHKRTKTAIYYESEGLSDPEPDEPIRSFSRSSKPPVRESKPTGRSSQNYSDTEDEQRHGSKKVAQPPKKASARGVATAEDEPNSHHSTNTQKKASAASKKAIASHADIDDSDVFEDNVFALSRSKQTAAKHASSAGMGTSRSFPSKQVAAKHSAPTRHAATFHDSDEESAFAFPPKAAQAKRVASSQQRKPFDFELVESDEELAPAKPQPKRSAASSIRSSAFEEDHAGDRKPRRAAAAAATQALSAAHTQAKLELKAILSSGKSRSGQKLSASEEEEDLHLPPKKESVKPQEKVERSRKASTSAATHEDVDTHISQKQNPKKRSAEPPVSKPLHPQEDLTDVSEVEEPRVVQPPTKKPKVETIIIPESPAPAPPRKRGTTTAPTEQKFIAAKSAGSVAAASRKVSSFVDEKPVTAKEVGPVEKASAEKKAATEKVPTEKEASAGPPAESRSTTTASASGTAASIAANVQPRREAAEPSHVKRSSDAPTDLPSSGALAAAPHKDNQSSSAKSSTSSGNYIIKDGKRIQIRRRTRKVVKPSQNREPIDFTEFTREEYLHYVKHESLRLAEKETDEECKNLMLEFSGKVLESFSAQTFPSSSTAKRKLAPNPQNDKARHLLEYYNSVIDVYTKEAKQWEKAKVTAQKLATDQPKERRRSSVLVSAAERKQRLADVELTSEDIDLLSEGSDMPKASEFEPFVKRFVAVVDELERTEARMHTGVTSMETTLVQIAKRMREKAFDEFGGVDQPLKALRPTF